MEKLMNFFREERSVCTSPIRQTRRVYSAPKVLQILVTEEVMSTVAASMTGSLNEPTTGISEEAKSQNFFLSEDSQEDPWLDYESE